MKRGLVMAALVALLVAPGQVARVASADTETDQTWSFGNEIFEGGVQTPDAGWVNPFGPPHFLDPRPGGALWLEGGGAHQGVWRLENPSQLFFRIPNDQAAELEKHITVTVIYYKIEAPPNPPPTMWVEVPGTAHPPIDNQLGDGWYEFQQVFDWACVPFEVRMGVTQAPPAHVYVDRVRIQTVCVSPPAAIQAPDDPSPAGPRLQLLGANPNPFSRSGTVRFRTTDRMMVRVGIYDARGRFVLTVAEGAFAAGDHEIIWDGRNRAGAEVANGTYFCEVDAGRWRAVTRLVVVR